MVGPVVAKMAVEQAQRSRQRHRRRLLLGRDRLDRRHVPGRLHPHVPGTHVDHRPGGRGRAGAPGGAPESVDGRAWSLGLLDRGSASASARSARWSGALALGGVDLGSYQINYLALAGNLAAVLLGSWRHWPACSRPAREDLELRRPGRERRPSSRARPATGPACPTWPSWPSSPAWPSWPWRWWPAGW